MPWGGWYYEYGEKRRERAEKTKAEAELAAAHNRADAAFFRASSEQGNFECGLHKTWFVSNGDVLSVFRDEVAFDTPAGTPIVLPLANEGEDVKAATFKKSGTPIHSIRYTGGGRGQDLWGILEYPFDPASLGKTEIVEVSFESRNGFHRIHRYSMEHGRRIFLRIDPPLPVVGR